MSDPLSMSIDEIRSDCIENIDPFLTDKVLFIGHSMGAILAYELLSDIENTFPNIDCKLIISSANAPKNIKVRHDISLMSDEEFSVFINNMGGIPDQIKKNDSLFQFFFPRIRYDFELLQQYQPKLIAPLKSQISVILAKHDDIVDFDGAKDWSLYSKKECKFHWCQGDHFYLFNNPKPLLLLITQCLQELSNDSI